MMHRNIYILRIYFGYGKKIDHKNFLKNIINNSLGHYLMQKAKENNLEQANMFHAKEGYLNYEKIKKHVSELPSYKNTVCIELIDTKEKLEYYLKEVQTHIHHASVVMMNAAIYKVLQ
jgi:PII-like signaling protein